MFVAKNEDGNNVRVEGKSQKAFCPDCNEEVFSVYGQKKRPHWRHKSECPNQDTWKINGSGETDWHLMHKEWIAEYCENKNIPYEIEKRFDKLDNHGHTHRTDAWINGICFEFQNSRIDPEVIRIREEYYEEMVWLFSSPGWTIHCEMPSFYYVNSSNILNYKSQIFASIDERSIQDTDKEETLRQLKELNQSDEYSFLKLDDIIQEYEVALIHNISPEEKNKHLFFSFLNRVLKEYKHIRHRIILNERQADFEVWRKNNQLVIQNLEHQVSMLNDIDTSSLDIEDSIRIDEESKKMWDEEKNIKDDSKNNKILKLIEKKFEKLKEVKRHEYFKLFGENPDEQTLLHLTAISEEGKQYHLQVRTLNQILETEYQEEVRKINSKIQTLKNEALEEKASRIIQQKKNLLSKIQHLQNEELFKQEEVFNV